MGCKSFGVSQVMVGLYRVGVVGLAQALDAARESGLDDRNAIVDMLVEAVSADNFIPAALLGEFRTALWREYLRLLGEDIREFYSEVEVVLRGDPGEQRDRFEAMTRSVLAEFELKPSIEFAPPGAEGRNPQLVIGDNVVVQGAVVRGAFHTAVRQSLSDW